MKCCINEQRSDQKSEQAPMTCYSQADLVGGCLTENHAKDRSRSYQLKECDRCEGAGDDQNEFNVCTNHYCFSASERSLRSSPPPRRDSDVRAPGDVWFSYQHGEEDRATLPHYGPNDVAAVL